MRRLVMTEPGSVGWEEAATPEPPVGGVVVEPTAVARCDLDAPMAAFGLFPAPIALGHEAVGRIAAVGSGVQDWAVEDRVLVPFQVSCGNCDACAGDAYAACEPYRAPAGAAFGFGAAGGGHPGAMADQVAVPHADHLLVALPEGVDDVVAAPLADNAVDGWRAVVPALEAAPGGDVLVVGGLAPSVGLYAVLAATAHGAGSVVYADDDPDRLAAARDLGADVIDVSDGLPERLPKAHVVVENLGSPEGLQAAVRATQPYGTCTSVAIHFGEGVQMPLLSMYTKGITFHTSRADARRFLPRIVGEVEAGVLDLTRLPLRVEPWETADDVWMEPATKLVLRRD